MAAVTVVVPCYNQGRTLPETLASIRAQTYPHIDTVVVDDGSDDPHTREVLSATTWPDTAVVHTDNHGLAAARNEGIRRASGEYILPLDADDLLCPRYVELAVAALGADPSLGIVYCQARLFGARTGRWRLPPYSLGQMLVQNAIFCSALFRRSDWQAVGGYRETMMSGYEDWDFWLSLLELGRGVHMIPQVLFKYRVRPRSMASDLRNSRRLRTETHAAIFRQHQKLFVDNIAGLLEVVQQHNDWRATRLCRAARRIGVPGCG
jgi:glycosyltransferase involved in cell wall biosynthesis